MTWFLMVCGWAMHWLHTVIKVRAAAKDAGKPEPSLWGYWTADPYTLALSILGLVVCYIVIPYAAQSWPQLAAAIGQTQGQPMNLMTAFLGGYVSPSLADLMGRRVAAMMQ